MSGFKIAIRSGQVCILSEDELPETDIMDLLEFDENQLEDLYKNHAAVQARWEQLAINLKNQYDSFMDEFERKWWAYNKQYAKLVLKAYGEKTLTIDSIKDQVILIYSNSTTELEREKYGELAYNYDQKNNKSSKDEFLKGMYRYINMNPPWDYETLMRTSKTLEKNYLTIHNVASLLKSRSFHMNELKDLVTPHKFNIGPVSETEKHYSTRGYTPKGER
jgi:hypothetical protein